MIVSLPRKSAAGSRGSPPDNDLRTKVLADPDDAALRSVWADALIEGGDPLGELIAIQDRARDAPLTAAQDKRMRSLVAKHRVAWLGPLSGVCQHREGLLFDRGLLAECQIQVKQLAALGAAVGDPGWTAVRRIWFCDRYAWDPRIIPLLVHPVMRSLREVFTIGMNRVFPALARCERPLPFTTIWAVEDAFRGPSPVTIRDVRDAPGLPALTRLGFDYHVEDYLLELPIVRRIATLGLINSNTNPAGVWLERTLRVENLTTLELRRYWIPIQGPLRSHFILSFKRGADGAWRELVIEPAGGPTVEMLAEQLDSIPANMLARITASPLLHPHLRRFKRAELVAG
jgi:uncharacterized protein (TIGR02996 family)